MESPPPSAQEEKKLDFSPYRDIVDIIKNKLLFFFPFFGAFLVFLFNKSDYISSAGLSVKLLCGISFLAGIFYAAVVCEILWVIESTRLAFTFANKDLPSISVEDRKNIIEVATRIPKMVAFENKLFRWTMYILWLTGFTTLVDIYFGALISIGSARLAQWIAHLLSH
jgi:hypothetical protein